MSDRITMEFNVDRVNQLASKLAAVAITNDQRELGLLAIEILVLRNNLDDTIEGDYSTKEKSEARAALKALRELERKVAYLYTTNIFRKGRGVQYRPFPSVFGKVKVRK
ncbi:MAG: hypothetical protein M1503_06665 [Thaumarchaeota archaeon]|nr:hypothetical protein [Nitrososphaerota archaeon]MCL5317924.1 hypothetical protein [Nitrososphaerota archaeon]